MRTFLAALLGAAACVPALVHATLILPDPADAAASVPAADVPSLVAAYQPYRDQPAPSWQSLNGAVTHPSRESGMDHGAHHEGAMK